MKGDDDDDDDDVILPTHQHRIIITPGLIDVSCHILPPSISTILKSQYILGKSMVRRGRRRGDENDENGENEEMITSQKKKKKIMMGNEDENDENVITSCPFSLHDSTSDAQLTMMGFRTCD